nr:hypothetical protein [Candidatus Sigynarchaeota archaeon]
MAESYYGWETKYRHTCGFSLHVGRDEDEGIREHRQVELHPACWHRGTGSRSRQLTLVEATLALLA